MPLPLPVIFDLVPNDSGQLVLKRPGADDAVDVRLRRSFPWTQPNELISIRDSEGKELLLIDRLDELPAAQRQQVVHWLDDASFIPAIEQVHSINNDFGYQIWDVATDRGPATFRVQEREDVRFLPDGRFSVKDVEGNKYVLPRLDRLDEKSRRAAETIL